MPSEVSTARPVMPSFLDQIKNRNKPCGNSGNIFIFFSFAGFYFIMHIGGESNPILAPVSFLDQIKNRKKSAGNSGNALCFLF